MKIIISCSALKNGNNLIYNNNEIEFVSKPAKEYQFRPDDIIPGENITWRKHIIQSQENSSLLKSYELYKPLIYKSLYDRYGSDLYILSAGWGIVSSEFKIPKYNITFSKNAEIISQRTQNDNFNDLNHLKGINENEKIIFIGGSEYLKLFHKLTNDLQNQKIIFYKKKNINSYAPFITNDPSYILEKYDTNTRTNWHYECAKNILNKKIIL